MPVTTLKRRNSLVGKNIMPLLKKLKNFNGERVASLARMKTSTTTEDLSQEELCKQFRELTGENEREVLEMARKDMNENNLRLLLHFAILCANEKGQPEGQDLQTVSATGLGNEEDEDEHEPPKKKMSKKEPVSHTAPSTRHEDGVHSLKDKVRFLCMQNHPSEALILLALDELSRKAKNVHHEDYETYEELLRQASRNQGKINIVNFTLNVLGGKASDLVTKALTKCLKDMEQKNAQEQSAKPPNQAKPEMTSPLASLYPQMSHMMQGYNPMMMLPQYMPFNYGIGPRPNFSNRGHNSTYSSEPRQTGPCLFCDGMGHLIKDCAKLKAAKQNK